VTFPVDAPFEPWRGYWPKLRCRRTCGLRDRHRRAAAMSDDHRCLKPPHADTEPCEFPSTCRALEVVARALS
jgi:hypothetical protein